jgi:thymidine kinase
LRTHVFRENRRAHSTSEAGANCSSESVQIFKPAMDTRYAEEEVVSHSSPSRLKQNLWKTLSIFLIRLKDSTRVVAIDEIQFFDEAIMTVVTKLAASGCRVICAGLDLDFRAQPFGPIPQLLAIADEVTKIHAICTVCGAPAVRSQRLN